MKSCYIFDLDGTLANGEHRLHLITAKCTQCLGEKSYKCIECNGTGFAPKQWDAYFELCDKDEPIWHTIFIAQALHADLNNIVIVSGRSGQVREKTEIWLDRYNVPYQHLYMRPRNDHTDDDQLKIQFLAQMRQEGWNPIMAFDDRTRVVNAWRAAGIPCAQVAPGDF